MTTKTQEVASKLAVSLRIAQKWAKNNNVKFIGSGNAKIYLWDEKDILNFSKRNKKRGNPHKKPKGK